MKTLADLKRQAKDFEWKLISNSFYKNIPEHQANYRRVSALQSTKMALETIKDGKVSESWMDFPKAKQLLIKRLVSDETGLSGVGGDWYEVHFCRLIPGGFGMEDKIHIIIYRLRPDLTDFI